MATFSGDLKWYGYHWTGPGRWQRACGPYPSMPEASHALGLLAREHGWLCKYLIVKAGEEMPTIKLEGQHG
jgi:hypothetical protein